MKEKYIFGLLAALTLWYGNIQAQSSFEATSLTVLDNNDNSSNADLLGKNQAGQQIWCKEGSTGVKRLYVNGNSKEYLHWSQILRQHKYGFVHYDNFDAGDDHSQTGSNVFHCFAMVGQSHVFYAAYSTESSSWVYKSPESDFSLYATPTVSADSPVWVSGNGGYSQMVKWNVAGLTDLALSQVTVMASYDQGGSWTNVATGTNSNGSTTVWLPRQCDRVRYRVVVTANDKYKFFIKDESRLTSEATADFVLSKHNIPANVNVAFLTDSFTDNEDITLRTRKARVSWNAELYAGMYGGTKIEYSNYDSDEWTELADVNNVERYSASETLPLPVGYDSLQFRVTVKTIDTSKQFKDSVYYLTAVTDYSPAFSNVALTGSLYRCYDATANTFSPTLTYTMNDDLYQTRVGQALVYYSTDEGQTWTQIATVASPKQEGKVTLSAISADKTKKYQFRIGIASAVNSAITCGIENASMVYAYSDVYVLDDTKTYEAEEITDRDVKVTRSFVKERKGTICLPFDLTEEQIADGFGAGAQVYEYTSLNNQVMQFTKVSTMQAGKPYVVVTAEDKESLTFYGVNIASEAQPQSSTIDDSYVFCGTFSPYDMATDQTQYFLATDGTLKYPANENKKHLYGYRCYFKLEKGSKAMVSFDGAMTGIDTIDADVTLPVKVYNLNGQYVGNSLSSLPKGVYIVNNRKTIIK